MQQLLKPSLDFDFNDVKFEGEEQPQSKFLNSDALFINQQKGKFGDEEQKQQFAYTAQFMNNMKDQMKHINQFQQYRTSQLSKKQYQRPQSAKQSQKQQQQQQKHKFLVKKDNKQLEQLQQIQSIQHSPQTSKSVKFGKTYISETIPVMHSNTQFSEQDIQIKKQQQNYASVNIDIIKKKEFSQQQLQQNLQQTYQSQYNKLQKFGILDWDDEMDDQFFIQETSKTQKQQQLEQIEKQNREQFLLRNQQFKSPPKSNEQILKQQQKEIQEKLASIDQLRLNNILSNKLVISQVPQQEDDEYGNDFEKEEEINKPLQKNKIYNQEEDEYGDEKFEEEEKETKQNILEIEIEPLQIYQQQKQQQKQQQEPLQQQKQQPQLQQQKKQQQQQQQKQKSKKQVVYRARTVKERKQELINMRQELEKYLISSNSETAKMYKALEDTKEKERFMVERNTQRREELSQARLTLQQLKEKLDRQQQIIDDLDKKEHYAQQIIQKLQENKITQQQQYDQEIEKFLACKIIARFMKGRRDRKLFLEMKSQKFMNKLKQ